jgi:hypothetical protein
VDENNDRMKEVSERHYCAQSDENQAYTDWDPATFIHGDSGCLAINFYKNQIIN